MGRKKKTRIYQLEGQTLEECKKYYEWTCWGEMMKNASTFISLSDDYDSPSWHNLIKILEES